MKKFFAFFLGFVMSLALLTGCDKSTATPTTDYHGEGEIQGGIKSDEDIAAITQEAEQNTEQPNYEDNTGHEPDAYGTGNFQDYWEGEDYFDIVGFAKANGCKSVFYYTASGDVNFEDESVAVQYSFGYPGPWIITPGVESCTVEYGKNNNTPSFTVYAYGIGESVPESMQARVAISKNNNATLSINTIQFFATILDVLSRNYDSSDPFQGTGLNYVQNN
ncbi:MAG: hypothetical protein J5824_06610 [Lachnospiraceae bacterium]|nr:hypothetical protein [Lachnospiraceae bacterium]